MQQAEKKTREQPNKYTRHEVGRKKVRNNKNACAMYSFRMPIRPHWARRRGRDTLFRATGHKGSQRMSMAPRLL